MENIIETKSEILEKVEAARLKIGTALEQGIITTDDLFWLLKQDSSFGLVKAYTFKKRLLQEIINCPFLLCDQENLDLNIKKLLPYILHSRYSIEIEELKFLRDEGFITKEELKKKRDLVKFCFYYTSEDGKYILRRGHVKNVEDNVIRQNKVLKLTNL